MAVVAALMMAAPPMVDLMRNQAMTVGRLDALVIAAGAALAVWVWLRESNYRPRLVVVCAVAMALSVALAAAAWQRVNPVTPDSCNYMAGGSAILHGQPYLNIRDDPQLTFPPGYPALIALGLTVVDDPELAGRLVSVLASLGCVILVYLLGARLAGWHAGAAAALLMALMPLRIRIATVVWSESVYLALLLIAIVVLWGWMERGGWNWAVGGGMLAGAAYLVRPEAMLLVGFAALVGWVHGASKPRWSAQPLGVLLGFAIVAAPYVLFLHSHTGEWELTHKTRVNLRVAEARSVGTPMQQMYRLNQEGGVVSLSQQNMLSGLAGRALRNAKGIWLRLPVLASPLVFVFAALGLFALFAPRAPGPGALTMGLALASPLVFLLPFFWEDRMLLCPAALLALLAAVGVFRAAQYVRSADRDRAAWLVVMLACVLMIGQTIKAGQVGGHVHPRIATTIGRWIAQDIPERSAMVSRLPVASYYANKVHHPLPYEELAGVIAYARTCGASLLLLPRERHHQSIVEYAQAPTDTDDLQVVHVWEDYVLVRVRLSSSASGTPRSVP
jgi:4-amino-4-deoxy-L-arabinose transferase-like glycosyltransferase